MAELGLRFGGGKSALNGGWNESTSKIGLCFGFCASAHISSRLVYQFEVDYVRKGAETYVNVLADDFSLLPVPSSIQFDYVEFPLLLKVLLRSKSEAGLALYVGPYGSLLLDSHVISKVPVQENGEIVTREFHDLGYYFDPSCFDWGLVWGIVLEQYSHDRKITFDFRYTYGFKNVVGRGSVTNLSNSMFSFTLGFGV